MKLKTSKYENKKDLLLRKISMENVLFISKQAESKGYKSINKFIDDLFTSYRKSYGKKSA